MENGKVRIENGKFYFLLFFFILFYSSLFFFASANSIICTRLSIGTNARTPSASRHPDNPLGGKIHG